METKTGFTLAEVLITLAIIEIVAALTIPSVVQNYQKHQTVTKLKKVYSALSNTTNLAVADNGPIANWEVIGGVEGSRKFIDTYMLPYLKVGKDCKGKMTGDCAFEYTYLNSDEKHFFGNDWMRFFLNDGTFIMVAADNYVRDGLNTRLAYIWVDINGVKPPNKMGKDIFYYTYYVFVQNASNSLNGTFKAVGVNNTRQNLVSENIGGACNKNQNGVCCAALIMRDGWEIKDDYPW